MLIERDYLNLNSPIRFEFPINGDCVNKYDGRVCGEMIYIKARIIADLSHEVFVNNIEAMPVNGAFEVEVPLYGERNTLVAIDKTSGNETTVVVYRLKNSEEKFYLSTDDVIICLQDITLNQDSYTSIFDNPFLAAFKKAHDLYNVKMKFYLFYELDEMKLFKLKRDYFNLSMMTEKFRDEWINNSDWLKLSFHSYRERGYHATYLNGTFDDVIKDYTLIKKEIVRFAGDATFDGYSCRPHFGEASVEATRALRTLGVKCLSGYQIDSDNPPASYSIQRDLLSYISKRDFWYDTYEDILYGKVDMILNVVQLDEIVPTLEKIKQDEKGYAFLELIMHEQYFYSDYANYIPEYTERILTACKWVFDNGYTSIIPN